MLLVQLVFVVTLLVRGNSCADMTVPVKAAISTMTVAKALYTVASYQPPTNGSYQTTVGLTGTDEAQSVEYHSTEFADTTSTSNLVDGKKPSEELGIASASTAISGAEYASTLYDRTLPQSPENGDHSTTGTFLQSDEASSAELHHITFTAAISTSEVDEGQTYNRALEVHEASTALGTSPVAIVTKSTAEYIDTLDDRTFPRSFAPSNAPSTERSAPPDEASVLHHTAFAPGKSTSDLAESQTQSSEMHASAALTEYTIIGAIGTLSTADFLSIIDDRTLPQSSAQSDYPKTDQSAPADEVLSTELPRTATATEKNMSNLAEGHTPYRGFSAFAAVSSTTEIEITSDANISSATSDETLRLSLSKIAYLTTNIVPQNDRNSSDKNYLTQTSLSNEPSSSHSERQAHVTTSAEEDAHSTSNVENGSGFDATEIKVGEVSFDSAHDYSIVGYSVGAIVILAAVAPTVFMLVHTQGLTSHCAGRLTLSPMQSNPA